MALFASRKLAQLEKEKFELLDETVRLTKQLSELQIKICKTGRELEEKLCEECGLSPEQMTKVKFLFHIERARYYGVPEDEILHNIEEITAYFTGES